MVFTSAIFLYVFLPVALLLFYVVPARWRAAPLLLSSAVFYAWGEPMLVVLILVTGLFTFAWGRLLIRQRGRAARTPLLAFGIAVVLVPIAVFKYLDFALDLVGLDAVADRTHLPLPIGVSFYTFMCISYLMDIHRRRDDGAPGLLGFSGFLTMYPHLVAGPIVRWHDIGPQLRAPRFDAGLFGYGALRVASGLAKKVVLADSLAVVVDELFATGEPRSVGAAWVAVLLYSLQIYLDFSAYSDIAIGLAAMMGVRFHENFRFPYRSRSAREFWQRWHISLGSWFRDYLYIPLGGSRVRPVLVWRNLMVVWGLTGLWHGAAWTFILWGLYYGVLIGLERSGLGAVVERLPRPVQHLYGVLVAVLGWVLFRSRTLEQAGDYYGAMLLGAHVPSWDPSATLAVQRTWVLALLAVVLAAGAFRSVMDRVELRMAGRWDPPRGVGRRSSGAGAEVVPVERTAPATEPEPSSGLRAVASSGASAVAVAAPTEVATAPAVRPLPSVGMVLVVSLVVGALLVLGTAFVVATTYSPFIYFRF